MNYIKQLQADKAEAIAAARSIETEINDLVSYLRCPKFHLDTRVQVGGVSPVLHLCEIMLYILATSAKGVAAATNAFV